MQVPNPIPLCELCDGSGAHRLLAVLDELTLTYSVVLREESGATRTLRRHVPALPTARRWALAYRDARMAS